jgi:hypothetical protein
VGHGTGHVGHGTGHVGHGTGHEGQGTGHVGHGTDDHNNLGQIYVFLRWNHSSMTQEQEMRVLVTCGRDAVEADEGVEAGGSTGEHARSTKREKPTVTKHGIVPTRHLRGNTEP